MEKAAAENIWIKCLIGLGIFGTHFRGSGFQAMKIATYDTDLTPDQWQLLKRFLPAAKKRGRPRTALRAVLNACLYLVKTGAQWRLLPQNFPPWQTVYHHFRQWSRTGLWARLNDRLRVKARHAAGKKSQPTAASLDSQTVRASAHGGEVGYDAAKKTKGRKRFLLVDTLGLLLGARVLPANCPERKGGRTVLQPALPHYPALRKLWVDGGFTGPEFAGWVKTQHATLEVEVVKRNADLKGFTLLPKRWVVERSFGWLMHCRRLVRDHEQTTASATAWIHLAFIRLMLRRLA